MYVQCQHGFTGSELVTCTGSVADITPTCTAYTKSTPANSTYTESYAESGFHCDLNDDGIEDSGEVIDFPDHSFVLEFTLGDDLLVSLPTSIRPDSDFYIAWGDESCSHITSLSSYNDLEHTFESPGSKTVRIIEMFILWGGSDTKNNYQDIISKVVNLGDVSWDDLGNAFSSSSDDQVILVQSTPTHLVTNMEKMFKNTKSMEILDLNGLSTSNVTNMSSMTDMEWDV